jgi:hypothetical protein
MQLMECFHYASVPRLKDSLNVSIIQVYPNEGERNLEGMVASVNSPHN